MLNEEGLRKYSNIAAQPESSKLDLKQEIDWTEKGRHELAKDVSAFANANGGLILVGVQETPREILGVDTFEPDRIKQTVTDRTYPPVSFYIDEVELKNGNHLVVLRIPRGRFVHTLMDDKTVYLRRGSISTRALAPEIAHISEKQRESRRQTVLGSSHHYFLEDDRIFLLDGSSFNYRTSSKSGDLRALSECPVFLPDFSLVTLPPQFGYSKPPVSVSYDYPKDMTQRQFTNKCRLVENRLRSSSMYIDAPDRFYWSISSDGSFSYGCGLDNLQKAFDDGVLGVVCLVAFAEYSGARWNRSFLVTINGYSKVAGVGKTPWVQDISIGLFSSFIPNSSEWVEAIFAPFVKQRKSFHSLAYEPAPSNLMEWRPITRDVGGPIQGTIRHFQYSRDGDTFVGGIVSNTSWYSRAKYKQDTENVTDDSLYSGDPKVCPLELIDEIVVGVTNPLPRLDQLERKTIKHYTAPLVRQITLDGGGHTIRILGICGHPWRPMR